MSLIDSQCAPSGDTAAIDTHVYLMICIEQFARHFEAAHRNALDRTAMLKTLFTVVQMFAFKALL